MPGDDFDSLLRRKLTPRPAANPVAQAETGVAGGLLRAFSRALSDTTPLVAESARLHRKRATLVELLDSIEPEAFVVTLCDGARTGMALIDQSGFSTLIEAMTIGRLSPRAPVARRASVTDGALLAALIDRCLAALDDPDPARAWRCARPVPDHRLLGVLLDDGGFDLVAITGELVAGDVARPLRLMLALPGEVAVPRPVDPDPAAPARQTWAEALEASVLGAPACLRAELGRVTLPLAEVLALGVGSRLTLPLSNLEEVRLVALDGSTQGLGRLGQTRGNRAVRLTTLPGQTPTVMMQDAAPRGLAAGLDGG